MELLSIWAHTFRAAVGPLILAADLQESCSATDTPPRSERESGSFEKNYRKTFCSSQMCDGNSSATSRRVRSHQLTVENVMGRSVDTGSARFRSRTLLRDVCAGRMNASFAQGEEDAGDHGVGVFVNPLVEKCRYLLAKIGRVPEAGEFIRLQGVVGCVEQELPGWLGALSGHEGLPSKQLSVNTEYRLSLIHI